MPTNTNRKTSAKSGTRGLHVVPASRKKAAAKTAAPPASVVKPPKLTREDRAQQDFAAILGAEHHEAVDTSFVILSYSELRAKGTEAMGDFAAKAKGVEAWNAWFMKQKAAKHAYEGVIIRCHPLDLHVPDGDDRINPRDFSEQEMIERVASMSNHLNMRLMDPLKVYIGNDGRLMIKGGETRWRSTLTRWIMYAAGKVATAPDAMQIIIEPKGSNLADRLLDVTLDNDSRPLKPLQIAANWKRVRDVEGRTVKEISDYVGKSEVDVIRYISMLELPEQVQKYIAAGIIRVTTAWDIFQECGKDAAKTVARIQAADRVRRAVGASRVMPKHDVGAPEDDESGGESSPPSVSTTRKGGKSGGNTGGGKSTKSKSSVDNALVKTLDQVSTVFPRPTWEFDGEGGVTLTMVPFHMSLNDATELHRRLGWELPESFKDAA